MRGKSMILIVIALGCGLVASIGISQILDRQGGSPATQTKKIYVAVRDVDISEVLDAEMIKLEEWPVEKIPEGAVTSLEEVKGLVPSQRLYAGEPIRQQKLVDPLKAGLGSVRIPKGYRVQAIKVKAEDIAGNLISPGDHVDVQVYLRKGGNISQTTTKTILEDVRVFAVGTKTSRDVDDDGKQIAAKTVSLLVKPPHVQTLLLASRLGQVSLSLRHPEDDSLADTSNGANVGNLISGPAEDQTPDARNASASEVAGKGANNAARDFQDFLRGLTKPEDKPAAPKTPAVEEIAKVTTMDVITPNGVTTFELIDDHRISAAREVGSVTGANDTAVTNTPVDAAAQPAPVQEPQDKPNGDNADGMDNGDGNGSSDVGDDADSDPDA